jgi:hypothetical protein
MKRLLFSITLLVLAIVASSQPTVDLGFKGGVHTTNLDISGDIEGLGFDSESITRMHFGAFVRVGTGKFYIQPEVYFSKKGGDVSFDTPTDIVGFVGGFDSENVDVPVLLGFKLLEKKTFNLRVMAGPVFSFVTNASYPDELDAYLQDEFFNDHLCGVQYGLGVDVLFLTIDARVEQASKIYDEPNLLSGKSSTFMLTVGFKIL